VITVRTLVPPDPALYASGVDVVTVPDIRWARCNVKSVSLLVNVLAKQQARDRGAFEALFVRDGYVVEGTTSNVAVMRDRVLITPPDGPLLLSGVTREVVLTVAQQGGVAVIEAPVSDADLWTADDAMLTGTTDDGPP